MMANVVLMVLLAAKVNHAAIDLLATVLPVFVRHVMAKADLHEKVKAVVLVMAKVDLPKGVIRDEDANRDAVTVLRARDLRAVRWDHRILNASWKMRCVLTPTLMAS